MKYWLNIALLAVAFAGYAAFGWVVGLSVAVIGLALLAKRLVAAWRALRRTLECPWCHAQVEQYGPYSCGSCRMRTLGWAWRCRACGEWAGHVNCPSCGMSVLNPFLEEP